MSIRRKTIKKYAEEQVVVMAGHHRLNEVMGVFIERKYAENAAYLVVCEADGRVSVMSFLELRLLIAQVGPKLAEMPLTQWQIPVANQVWVNEEVKSSFDVIEWVARRPTSRGVVVDKLGQFICLFTNTNLCGSPLGSSLLCLHGNLADLNTDWRLIHPSDIEEPTCPHCQHQDFYDIQGGNLVCKECGEKIKEL